MITITRRRRCFFCHGILHWPSWLLLLKLARSRSYLDKLTIRLGGPFLPCQPLPSSDLILPGLTCSCYRTLFQVFIYHQRVGLNELRIRVAFEEPVAAHKGRSALPFITQRPSRWLCRCSFFLSALSFDMRRFALSYTVTRRLQCSLSISPTGGGAATAPMQTDGRPSPLLSAQASEHR